MLLVSDAINGRNSILDSWSFYFPVKVLNWRKVRKGIM